MIDQGVEAESLDLFLFPSHSLHPEVNDLWIKRMPPKSLPNGSAHHDREVAEVLREFLESRRRVHRVPDSSVFDLCAAADVAQNRAAAVKPDSDPHGISLEDEAF